MRRLLVASFWFSLQFHRLLLLLLLLLLLDIGLELESASTEGT